jgi:SAM-dependent methyltransferase
MEYEDNYSRTQIHFVTQPPEWGHSLDADMRVHSILDLGAGGGRNSVYLRQVYPNAILVPFDLSLIRCNSCRQVVGASITCGDSMELPFADNSFDLIISTQVIEHVPDDHIFAQEVKRVLRPRGLAIVSSVTRLRFGWYFYRNHHGEWVLDPTHVREYRSADEFASLFTNLFSVLSLSTERFRFSLARFSYRLLVKLGMIRRPDPTFFSETRIANLLEGIRVPIPRYQQVTIVLKKR